VLPSAAPAAHAVCRYVKPQSAKSQRIGDAINSRRSFGLPHSRALVLHLERHKAANERQYDVLIDFPITAREQPRYGAGFAGADPFPELAASWMASSPRLEHRYRARPSTVILSRAARPSVPLSSALPPAPEAPVAAPAQRSPSQMAAGDTILTSTPTRCKHYKPPRGRPVSRAPGGRARRPSGADLRASMIAVSRPAPQFTLARAPTCADRHGWA